MKVNITQVNCSGGDDPPKSWRVRNFIKVVALQIIVNICVFSFVVYIMGDVTTDTAIIFIGGNIGGTIGQWINGYFD